MSQDKEDEKVRRDLQALARHIDRQLPYGWGFVLLAFPFGQDGRMNYVANAARADVVRTMYEFIEATKEKFGEHIAEEGAGAEDEQLARLRQRVAELERKLK
jgi:hypothetical protein